MKDKIKEKAPELQASSIVFIGSFNPKIFQPAWFVKEELIQKQEGDEADIEIIHNEFVSFGLHWLKLSVRRDRFQVSTSQESYYEILKDLALGTFKLLKHTPISQMGINLHLHFRMNSENEWHNFGHKLAPKEIWNKVLTRPGMLTLSMQGDLNRNDLKGYRQVSVEPSPKVLPGVYFTVNDHYEVKDKKIENVSGCEEIVGILETNWHESIKASKEIIYQLLENV